jgi:ABC-type transport system involved in cytochrome bd biosynthesis fused ATPase/permease subunit
MTFMPRALASIADSRNALQRLSLVFHAEVLTDVPFVVDPNQKLALEARNVTFEWEKSAPKDVKNTNDKAKDDSDSHDEPFQVRNINISLPRGILAGIVGSVGSGKSSLLQGLIGEMKKVEGELSFGGQVAYCPQTAWIQNATVVSSALLYARYVQTLTGC